MIDIFRDRVLQLSNTKATRYKESSAFNENHKFARTLTAMGELTGGQTFPTFGELDVVGVVIHVREPDKPWGVTNVYLSDLDNNFLMITFWTSLKVCTLIFLICIFIVGTLLHNVAKI